MSERSAIVQEYLEALPRDLKDIYKDSSVRDYLIDLLSPGVSDGFQIFFVGPPGSGFEDRHEGVEGLISSWGEWTSPYETYLFELKSVEEIGNAVVTTGRQAATLPGGKEQIDMPSIASVWWFEGDKIVSIEFHLDRTLAYERARSNVPRSVGETG